jgi:uncharacterized protein
MQIDFPFHFDRNGRTATTDEADHIRDMIEQVLFTAPGERLNRPDFGSGVMQLVFQPNSPELAATTQYLVQASLQQWLSEVIVVNAVDVASQDASLTIRVDYTIRRTQEQHTDQFHRGGV